MGRMNSVKTASNIPPERIFLLLGDNPETEYFTIPRIINNIYSGLRIYMIISIPLRRRYSRTFFIIMMISFITSLYSKLNLSLISRFPVSRIIV